MQVQIDIKFEQLVQLAKELPAKQWKKFKQEVESSKLDESNNSDLLEFLLSAPTFKKEQLETIEKTRKEINQWRTN